MTSEIEGLAGQLLCQVQFVEDYVCLVFSQAALNAYAVLSLMVAGLAIPPQDKEFKATLLGLVGHYVRLASEYVGDELHIEFSNDTVLRIPIDDVSRPGIEAAWYYEPQGSISKIW